MILIDRYDISHLGIHVKKKSIDIPGYVYDVHVTSGTLFKCDNCDKEFARPRKGKAQQKHLHFCSQKCSGTSMKSGGVSESKRRATSKDRYGEENYSSTEEYRQHSRASKEERYGDPNYCGLEKRLQTNIEKYGSPGGALRTPEVIARAHSPEARKKRLLTLTENDSLWTYVSKPEKILVAIFQEYFGHEAIKPQKHVDYRPIDVWIKSLDVFVQIDGVFWHGTNVGVEELELLSLKKDYMMSIYRKYLSDREQDAYFRMNWLKLLRVSDSFVKQCMVNNDFSSVINAVMNAKRGIVTRLD